MVAEHASVVQASLSLHTSAAPLHAPVAQTSLVVQALPSLQVVPSAAAGALQVPDFASQASTVQGLLSLQTVALPGAQVPLAHKSLTVQALPSVQALPVSAVKAHLPAVQALLVQALLSSHSLAARQLPPQPLMALATHKPDLASQLSMVQGSLSSHGKTPLPVQLPPVQASDVVQVLPSLHGKPLVTGTKPQAPVVVTQASLVQALLSLHTVALPWQTPVLQASAVVHA